MTEFRDYKNISAEKEEDAQYFCKFTFGQFFTIIVLEVITLSFVFYLGAKYGTNYLKVGQEEQQTNITSVVANSPAPSENIPAALQDKELQQMARDAVKESNSDLKERVKEMLNKKEDVAPAQAQAPAPVQTQLPAQTIQQQQAAPAQEQAQAAQVAQADSGAIKVKSSASGAYSIQVGSYPNMDEAGERVKDWREKGYPSFMMIADIPDRGRWYRVRIGGFASKEDAQAYLDKFKINEQTEAIVVLNEQ